MKRILPALIIAILFHAALFAVDPGLIIKKPGRIKKPAITVTMSYRKKPAPPPAVKKPPEIKKKTKVKAVKKIRKIPAPVKEKKPVPEPVRKETTVENKVEAAEKKIEDEPVQPEADDSEEIESAAGETASPVETEAMPLYSMNPEPGYPKMARKRGYQGTVLLNVLVNKEGTVENLWLSKSSGYKILDNAAIKAVKDWTFEPGRRGDEAIEMWVEIPVIFEIK